MCTLRIILIDYENNKTPSYNIVIFLGCEFEIKPKLSYIHVWRSLHVNIYIYIYIKAGKSIKEFCLPLIVITPN